MPASRKVRRSHAAAALLLGTAMGLGPGCRPASHDRASATLTLAVKADITGIFPNPPVVAEDYTIHVNENLFEGLVRFGRSLNLEPALAERWENPDDRTYFFVLRSGLRFSSGEPLTPEDVVASLLAGRRWVLRDDLQAIESASAVGGNRVEIRTRFPYPILLFKLPGGFVLPARAVATSPVPPVGTGPYYFERWLPGKELLLRRNPHYRGPRPSFERARFVVVPDAAERIGKLLRGEADLADGVPLEQVERLQSYPDLRVVARPSIRVLFLALRVDEPPFSDPRVREALDLSIDRENLVRQALAGRARPASQLVPPGIVGYNPTVPIPRRDSERAKRLLAEAGYPKGFSVRLDGTYNRYPSDRAILQEVARQLAEVSVRVEVNAMDKRDFFPLISAGRSKMHLVGPACESGDAGDVLDALMHSASEGLFGSNNTMGLSDAELDRLIDEANRKLGSFDRNASLQAALARVAALRPIIPLAIPTEAVAFSRRILWNPPLNFALRVEEMRPAP